MMTLDEALAAARIAAIEAHPHVCNCDFSDPAHLARHEVAMKAQHAAMAAAEAEVLLSWREAEPVPVNKTARRKKDSNERNNLPDTATVV